MGKLQLSFACALYDRMEALYTGEVQPEGIDLNFIPIEEPRPIRYPDLRLGYTRTG